MLMTDYLRHVHRAGLQRYVETGQRHISCESVQLPGLHQSGREIPLELSFGELPLGPSLRAEGSTGSSTSSIRALSADMERC